MVFLLLPQKLYGTVSLGSKNFLKRVCYTGVFLSPVMFRVTIVKIMSVDDCMQSKFSYLIAHLQRS